MKAASLRAKFLLIVLLGAVLPLAIVGWWLTGTAVRSGRALLRGQLEAAVGGIASDARAKWTLREGELQLLANNSVVRTALAAPAARLAMPDSEYLLQLFAAIRKAIPSVSYVDGSGRERWSFQEAETVRSADSARGEVRSPTVQSRTFPVEMPVQSEDGRVVGTLRARVRLSAVLASVQASTPCRAPCSRCSMRGARSSRPRPIHWTSPRPPPIRGGRSSRARSRPHRCG